VGEETQGFILLFCLICNIITTFFSLSIKCFSSLLLSLHLILLFQSIISKTTPLPSPHHDRPSGQGRCINPKFCKCPPLLYLIASLHNSIPINTPSPSLSLHLLPFFFFASCSQERSHQERASSSCFLCSPNSTTFNLSPSLCETGHPLGFWPRSSPLTNLEPATPFGLGPNFPSLDAAKILLGE